MASSRAERSETPPQHRRARGIGKTVILSSAEEIARNHGCARISRTANPGFLARIGDDMLRLLVSAERSEVDGHYGSCAGDRADLDPSAGCCSDA